MQKYLTRKEELVLLAICHMKSEAYLVNIREYLNRNTEKQWTVGNVWVPLDKMAKIGYLETYVGSPTAKRGGKSIRYYRISKKGMQVLLEMKKFYETMWKGLEHLIAEE